MSALPLPKLVILEHTSQAEEKYVRNGEQKNVHVVVKNTPFFIKVGFTSGPGIAKVDFNRVTLEAQLMYDCDGDRIVDFVRNKPLEYKGSMNEEADLMTLEVRLKKLSSHLEDMFFKIRIKGLDCTTKEAIPALSVTTHPIKVVSKPEQVARIKEGQTGAAKAASAVPKPRTKKRSLNELLYESMQKIEKQQQEQQQLLQQLTAPKGVSTDPKGKASLVEPVSLEGALRNLLQAYNNTEASERPMKIRKLIRNAPGRDIDALSEFTNHLQYSLQKDETAHSHPSEAPTQNRFEPGLSLDELNRIDEIYRDLLFNPAPGSTQQPPDLW